MSQRLIAWHLFRRAVGKERVHVLLHLRSRFHSRSIRQCPGLPVGGSAPPSASGVSRSCTTATVSRTSACRANGLMRHLEFNDHRLRFVQSGEHFRSPSACCRSRIADDAILPARNVVLLGALASLAAPRRRLDDRARSGCLKVVGSCLRLAGRQYQSTETQRVGPMGRQGHRRRQQAEQLITKRPLSAVPDITCLSVIPTDLVVDAVRPTWWLLPAPSH